MEKHTSKLQSQQQEELTAQQQKQQQTSAEFATVEDLLRYDADQTPVPAEVTKRLQKSLAQQPKPPRPWWRRWFGKADK